MAARRTPPPNRESFYPQGDNAVYRDLLLFEERLKTNASILRKRKSRYQLFLVQLLFVIAFLMTDVFFETRMLDLPFSYAMRRSFPEAFAQSEAVQFHPYVAKGLLLVAITTLLLFFASGLYEEKIAYANRYVPHANRALRNFNMYLNVRHKPLRSRLSFDPFSIFRHKKPDDDSQPLRTPSPDRRRKRGTSVPIAPIPPTNNPRGELIFSSRVDRTFRESYERYRTAFERKREAREEYAFSQTWRGWRGWPWNWTRRVPPQPASYVREHTPTNSIINPLQRGREPDVESTHTTPTSSRRASPTPGSLGRSRGSAIVGGSGTPPRAIPKRLTPDRTRTESFSFLLSGDESFG